MKEPIIRSLFPTAVYISEIERPFSKTENILMKNLDKYIKKETALY